MKYLSLFVAGLSALLVSGTCARGETKIVVAHTDNEHARAGFRFQNVPVPSKVDAASSATFTLVDGERDRNGGGLEKLHDGQGATEADQPSANFFFNA
ncbi:MAG TPA: hypothetical protein VNT26_09405, partial [Candidatus Sulfotelmatobacter sp.]|nr:hypothetical protein [Candidatus Sulfotelmatobacter sp.]